MNVTYRNGKDRNAGKKYQGCLGKMVNLFELNIGLPANKRITDKPHQDGFTSSRRISSDLSSTTTYGDRAEVKETKSDRKSHIKPVKMLMDQEMSKELRYKQSPPNLVAKLMGLDSLPPQPQENPNRAAHRAHTRSRSVIPLSDYEQDNGFHERVDDDEKMALVRQKFAEAKLLSMDEKHRNSKKLQDALDVLNSNKDLFLKCLQEPRPLFRNNYDDPHLPAVEKKRITILRPSKLAEDDQNGRQKNDDISFQPTRIVVLKPKSQIDEDYAVDAEDEDDDDEGREAREVAKAITIQVREKLGRYHAMDSSLFSKGYAGDDSSFNRSEFEYSEAMSPVSRHSWDCVNRAASPYSPSALSRASYSSESSVSREAKKRLSERWALMSTTTNEIPREIRTFHRSSSTLGEMLSLSEVKKAAAVSAEGEIVGEEENGKDSNNLVSGQRLVAESGTPSNLIRSKSLPASSATKEEAKTANSTSKSSLRVKVSNLLFSRNRKAGKEKSLGSTIEDGIQPISGEKTPVNASPSSQECPSAVVSLSDHIGKKDITCSEDKPSPLSVLDAAPFEEDLPRCEPINKLGSKAIDKSPPIGSIARTLSYDDVRDPSTSVQESDSDKQEYVAYVETLLFSGLKGPLDPSLRDKYVDQSGKEGLTEAKRRQKRSMQKLMFDYVSAELVEDDDDKGSSSSSNLLERVNEWFCRRNVSLSENFGDDYIMVVEGVVREEVIGRKWIDGLREEREVLGGEIEGKLIEELVVEMISG